MFVRRAWRRLSLAVIAIILLSLGGCAGALGPERWKSLPEGQRAVIFGTISAYESGIALSTSRLHFRNVETGETGSISAAPGNDVTGNPDIYIRNKEIGWVFELTVPPGRYEFYSYFSVRNFGQFGSTQYRSKQDFSVPFAVEANKTHYLGEYRALAFIGRNIFGMSLADGGYFHLLNSQERDTALLAKKRKAPVDEPIVNIVPNPDQSSLFIRRTPYGAGDTVTES